MAAHRYWRILITDTSVTASIPALAELQMAESAFGANVCSGGTASASTSFGSSLPAGAFDGTFYSDNGAALWGATTAATTTAQWLQYDFGAGNAKAITSIRILARQTEGVGGGPGQSPKDFTVQSSDDNSTFTTEWTVSGSTGWVDYELRHFHKTAPVFFGAAHGSHVYWRLALLQGAAAAYAGSELQLNSVPGGSQVASGGTSTAFQSFGGAPGTFDSTKLFDANTGTLWSSNDKTNPAWVQYQFASAVSLAEFIWQARNDGNYTQSPTRFVVLWSDSGTSWNMAWSAAVSAAWASAAQTKTFTDPNYNSSLGAAFADDTGLAATIRVITPCVWDDTREGSEVILSSDKLTMHVPDGAANEGGVVGTIGQNRGRKYFELTVSNISSSNQFSNWGVIAERDTINLNFAQVDEHAYKGTFRYGPWHGGGHWDLGGPITIGVAVDFTSGRVSIQYVGGGFGSTPTPLEFTTVVDFGKTYYPWSMEMGVSGDGSTTLGPAPTVLANFGFSAFAIGLPSGYTSWDTSQGSDATAPNLPTTTIGYHSSNVTLSSDELSATTTSATNCGAIARAVKYFGKHYFEAYFTTSAGLDGFGIIGPRGDIANFGNDNHAFWNNGVIRNQNNTNDASLAGYAAGTRIGVAVDLDNNRIWYRAGPTAQWNGSGTANPETNVGGFDISTLNAGLGVWPWMNFEGASGDEGTFVFDNGTWTGTAPFGFDPWFKSDTLLQYEWGSTAITAGANSTSAGGTLTSNNYNSLGAGRLLVVDCLTSPSAGHTTDALTITDTAGLIWTKRQDHFDSGSGVRFIRWWAYSLNALSTWNFTIGWATSPNAVRATLSSWQSADSLIPFDDGSTSGPLPTADGFPAATTTMTTTAVDPQSSEIVLLGVCDYGGTGFDVGFTTGAAGDLLIKVNSSTFVKGSTVGKYYDAGVVGKQFSFTPHSGDSYGIQVDAIRAFTGEAPSFQAQFEDDLGLSATLTNSGFSLSATFTDDIGISTAILDVRNAGDLFASITDGGSFFAILGVVTRPPPIQVVVVCQ